jgi:hypothetical protein
MKAEGDTVMAQQVRFYATLKTTPDLLALYRRRDLPALTRFTIRLLDEAIKPPLAVTAQPPVIQPPVTQPTGAPPAGTRPAETLPPGPQPSKTQPSGTQPPGTQPLAAQPAGAPLVTPPFAVHLQAVSAPSLDWRSAFVPPPADTGQPAGLASPEITPEITPDELIIAYDLPDPADAHAFLDVVSMHRNRPLDGQGNAFLGGGFDPGSSVTDHWCPGAANLATFGHRGHARRTLRAEALVEKGFFGQNVNVVIIDEGLDKNVIPARNWGGGLNHYIDTQLVRPAGSALPNSHGMMIARSILDLAPNARLYDVPAIPPANPPPIAVFVSSIQAACESLLHEIRLRRGMAAWSGPWVLVNAWGIFNTETDPSGSYTRNTQAGGHPMINFISRTVQKDHLDWVFAAGNCGLFCPSQLCGGVDRGPGHSIWGANAHPLVLTAGAVRSDETWVGYSSQGPGPALLGERKPDLCAPSHFCENNNAALLSSGSSAACAMAAGVVAALRGNPQWNQANVTPQALKAALIAGARKPHGPAGWDDRLGFGIINVAATIAALPP